MESPPPAQQPPPAPGYYAPPPAKPSRPIGVTILGILTILFGIITLLGGVLLIVGAGLLGAAGSALGLGFLAGLLAVFGALIALFGLLAIISGWGLLKLRPWAWTLTMIVGILEIIFSALSQNWVTVALWLIIVVYLFVVRKHFTSGGHPAGM